MRESGQRREGRRLALSGVTAEDWERGWREGLAASRVLDLPLKRRVWRGQQGGFQGRGSGASLDFQDHRHYLVGDDPRHINWQAFARTNQYTMKVFHEEVRPMVDVVLDASPSMQWPTAKAVTSAGLLALVTGAAGRAGASLRLWLAAGARVRLVEAERLLAGGVFEPWHESGQEPCEGLPDPHAVMWRAGSLRVVISDLLAAGDAAAWSAAVLSGSSAGLLLVPWSRQESDPDWGGHRELLCVESGRERIGVLGEVELERYRRAWRAHMDLWRADSRRAGMAMALVEAGPDSNLVSALRAEALPREVFEPCS